MFIIPARDQVWEISSPQVMGILNTTSDSFYAESRYSSTDLALTKATEFYAQGASIIDVGGQSTRPGATQVDLADEIKNVVPVISAIKKQFPQLLISIDTYHASVAKAALDAGANIVNDISCGSFDPDMLKVVSDNKAGFVGMHITGNAQSMHKIEARTDIMQSVLSYFEIKRLQLASLGIQQWVMDPGFGFGKTVEENFAIIKNLKAFSILEMPILLGVSRKSSIYKTLGITPEEALNGTTVVNTVGLLNGASIVRVHDVKQAQEIIQLLPYLK